MLDDREFRNPIEMTFSTICRPMLPLAAAIMCFLHLKKIIIMYYNISIHLSKALHLQIIFKYVISHNFSHFAEKEQSWEAIELSPGSSSVASQTLYDARVDTGLIPHWRLTVLFVIITRLNSVVRHTCFSDSWWQRVNLSKIN